MSTEAQVAMLMLRLLIDKPKELQKVMNYLQREVSLRKSMLEAGNMKVATREEIMNEFEDMYGLTIDITDEPETPTTTVLSEDISNGMLRLPSGARFKVG